MTANLPAVEVGLAFGYTPYDASPVYIDVTPKGLDNLSTKRGRAFELDNFQPGTMSVTLDNTDGRYTPPGASPYANQVLLNVPVRVRATWSGNTYPIWQGFLERVDVTWDGKNFGTATITATDWLSLFAQINQALGALGYAMAVDGPAAMWPLDDPDGSTTARQTADSNSPAATLVNGTGGITLPTFGSAMPALVGAGSTPAGVSFHGSGATYTIGAGLNGYLPTAISGSFSVVGWAQVNVTTLTAGQQFGIVRLYGTGTPSSDPPGLAFTPAGLLGAAYGGASNAATYGGNLLDNTVHQVAVAYDASSHTLTVFADGAPVNAVTDSTAGYSLQRVSIGSSLTTAGKASDIVNGRVAAVAVYDHALTPAQIAAQYEAGLKAGKGERTDQRITRLASYSGYPVTVNTPSVGSSQMQTAMLASESLAQAMQETATTESGRLFVDGGGLLTFLPRGAEFNQTTVATFGENTGETHYSGVTFTYGPDHLYNDISVTRNGGATARSIDPISIGKYGRRTYAATIYSQYDEDADSLAGYLLVRWREPKLAIAAVTLNPAANPALWPVVLGSEIGNIVTHNRRPPGLSTITGTYIVESIAHSVSASATTWATTFELTQMLAGLHFWRIDDPVYGQVDNPDILVSP